MSEDFLKNPLSLFDVRGKTAIVTGASGAFGALAAKVLAGAGANVVLAAGNAEALKKVAGECERSAPRSRRSNMRPSSEANCDADRQGRGQALRPRRHSGGRLRHEQGVEDRRPGAGGVPRRHGRQRHPVLADGARGRQADAGAGRRRQGHPDVVGARAARPSGRLHRLLRVEVGDRRHHQGARLRMGRHRHHRQRASRRPSSARRSPPGCTRTPSARPTVRKGFLARVPKGRLGEPADLAGPLLFLASKASDFYTGHILYADGGYTAG